MSSRGEDWASVLQRLRDGDPRALLRLSRLVNSFLVRWNAYGFRDDWEDLIQEIVFAAGTAMQEGRLREPGAVVTFLRVAARHKFVDQLRAHLRWQARGELPWEEVVAGPLEPSAPVRDPDVEREVREAVDRLPEKQRAALLAVYVEGRTYDEAAEETGIPLGSLKRALRDGLAQLRGDLARLVEDS